MIKFLLGVMFYVLLVVSLVFGISQVSLFSSWVGLEMNMLMFIAIMSLSKSNMETTGMKYFVVQSIGSSLFLSGVGLLSWQVVHGSLSLMISMSLLLKLGVAPVHSWFVSVLSGLSWELLVLASTSQKVIPLYLFGLFYFDYLSLIIGLSALISVLGSLEQMEVKKLMAYSSIFSAAWMLSSGGMFSVVGQYLAAYGVALIGVAWSLAMESNISLNESLQGSGLTKISIYFMSFFSLGGSPPFLGFYAKILLAQEMILGNHIFILFILVVSSVFLLYAYMRIFYYATTLAKMPVEGYSLNYFLWGPAVLLLVSLGLFPFL